MEYSEDDLLGLEEDLKNDGDLVGARTARECAKVMANLKDALEFIAAGQANDPVLFAKTFMERYSPT